MYESIVAELAGARRKDLPVEARERLSIARAWLREANQRAKVKADPIRAEHRRRLNRENMRVMVSTHEGRERHRASSRKGARRYRAMHPEVALIWNRHPTEQRRYERAATSSDGSITPECLQSLEMEGICPYCCEPLNDETREIDHIEPLAKEGRHIAENLAAVCARCNRAKASLRLIEFLIRRTGIAAVERLETRRASRSYVGRDHAVG